jgi:outer membrane protein OmpA-like peptidoglycan-associated protein/tetratricopeptide (TPR) repeat protein
MITMLKQNIMRQIILIIALVGISFTVISQNSTIKKAEQRFEQYDFENAINQYSKTENHSLDSRHKLAESYYRVGNLKKAEEIFAKLATEKEATPEDIFSYASILEERKKYSYAKTWMDKFAKLKPNDKRAISYLKCTGGYKKLQKNNNQFTINNLEINSENEDFGAVYYKDCIVFASSRVQRKAIKRRWSWNKQPFLDIYKANINENNKITNVKIFTKKINKKYHEGPVCFTSDLKKMVFTRNNYLNKSSNGTINLQLFESTLNDNEQWSEPKALPYNSPEYSVGHASISNNGTWIYFASDMPGGSGGVDIYKAKILNNGTYGTPINLGDKINTEANEMFPVIDSHGMLFFASNGLAGVGGLDVFVAQIKEDNSIGQVKNLGTPVNSNRDDFAFILSENGKFGYLSSNRDGGKGDDDIYSVEVLKPITFIKPNLKIELVCKIIDKKTKEPIPGVSISLLDKTSQKSEKFVANNNGICKHKITGKKKNDETTFVGKLMKKGYFPKTINRKITFDHAGVYNLMAELDAEVKDLREMIQINPINFDLNKYNIRPDAKIELNKIVEIMNKYPELVIELGSHTDCRGSKKYNLKLSEKRAKASAQYIKSKIIKPERIYGKGYGESQLLNKCACEGKIKSNCSEKQHAKNRRTEFKVIKTGNEKLIIDEK